MATKCLTENKSAARSRTRDLLVIEMGRLSYGTAQAKQERIVEVKRQDRSEADRLLLMELDPIVTIGTGGNRDHLLVGSAWLRDRSIEFCECRRGGGATFHGPGQLTAYPIIDVSTERDLRSYLRRLEEVVIETLAIYNLRAHTVSGLTGVWIGENKIAAIGIRAQSWITSYGVAINIAPDLSNYRAINQCGLSEKGVTSIERELGVAPSMNAVAGRFVALFRQVLGYDGG